jgi:lysyl endopeptidase
VDKVTMKKYLLIPALTLLTLPAYAEQVETVQDNRIVSKSSIATTSSAFLGSGAQSSTLNLPAIQVDLGPSNPGIHKSGVVYQMPTPLTSSQLTWERVNNGYVARIHLASVQAKRLRYHLIFSQAISDITFRVQGSMDALPLKPISQKSIHDNNIWLPITKGNTADLEVFVNDTKSPEALFNIDAINIIVEDLNNGNPSHATIGRKFKTSTTPLAKTQSIGYAEQFHEDVACWTDVPQYPALQRAADATALIDFIDNGESFVCTGTLLNDTRRSGRPWFTTANHCLPNQAVANTAIFEWFFQATYCGEPSTDSRYTITYGGAQLLWTNVRHDVSFLKLNELPPMGASYNGWNSNRLNVGNRVWGVHNPSGDHTMAYNGEVTALSKRIKVAKGKVNIVNIVESSSGGAESGSSGSGLFSISNETPYWRGTLSARSPKTYHVNGYSSFGSYYPKIKRWLGVRKRR